MADAIPPIPADAQPPRDNQATSLSLLDSLRAGQNGGWERLDKLYRPLVYFWLAQRNIVQQDQEELCQEVFLVVMKRVGDFHRDRPGDSFRGWLRGITRNVVRTHLRQRGTREQPEGGTDAGRLLHEVPDPALPDEEEPEEEQVALLHRALALIQHEFPTHHWRAFQLTVVEQLDASAAAKILGMSPAAIRQAKARMLRRLREELGDC